MTDSAEKLDEERPRDPTAAKRQAKRRRKQCMRELGYRYCDMPIRRENIGALVGLGSLTKDVVDNVEDEDEFADRMLEDQMSELIARLVDELVLNPALAEKLRWRR